MGELLQIVPLAHAAVASLGVWSCFWLMTANSLLGMLLNYSLFLCTVHNSALTTTIVGVLKVCAPADRGSSNAVDLVHWYLPGRSIFQAAQAHASG